MGLRARGGRSGRSAREWSTPRWSGVRPSRATSADAHPCPPPGLRLVLTYVFWLQAADRLDCDYEEDQIVARDRDAPVTGS